MNFNFKRDLGIMVFVGILALFMLTFISITSSSNTVIYTIAFFIILFGMLMLPIIVWFIDYKNFRNNKKKEDDYV